MGTLYVVSINLELRLGVDLCIIGEQQVAIGLLGVSFLRVFVDHNSPVKNAVRFVVQNAVIELPAGAMRARVLDVHVVIEMLLAAANKESIDQALATFSCQDRMHIVAHQPSAQQKRM